MSIYFVLGIVGVFLLNKAALAMELLNEAQMGSYSAQGWVEDIQDGSFLTKLNEKLAKDGKLDLNSAVDTWNNSKFGQLVYIDGFKVIGMTDDSQVIKTMDSMTIISPSHIDEIFISGLRFGGKTAGSIGQISFTGIDLTGTSIKIIPHL